MTLLLISIIACYFFMGCQDEDAKNTPVLELSQSELLCNQKAVITSIPVKSNIEWSANVPSEAATWCKARNNGTQLQVTLTENTDNDIRETDISLKGEGLEQKLHVKQLGQAPAILVPEKPILLHHRDTTVQITVVSNVPYEVSVPDTVDWITSEPQTRVMVESAQTFRINANTADISRFTEIAFTATTAEVENKVMITQEYRNKNYIPGTPEGIGDIKIPVTSGKASQAHDGEGIEKSFDGNMSTIYHSPWGDDTKMPVTLEYFFEKAQVIDYLRYYPRRDGISNGNFGEVEIWIASEQHADYQSIGTFQFSGSGEPRTIQINHPTEKIISVKFVVNNGVGGFASCSEMEFYRKGAPIIGLEEVFADDLYAELKEGVTQQQIDGIENLFFRGIAQSLFDGTYDKAYRTQDYEAYRPVNDLAAELKTGGYCPFENATGIYFDKPQEAIIIVGDTKGETVKLTICDFDAIRQGTSSSPATYLLIPGINKITVSKGLAYIDYFTANWKQAEPIKVHIPSGKINGYFDKKKHTTADWMKTLGKAGYGCLDIKGEYVNLVFGTESMLKNCSDGAKLINVYDDVVALEYDIMGLVKYKRVPKNHMFARVVKSGLFADGWGAGFQESYMNELGNPEAARKGGVWAIAHEFGHVNQIRPGLKWVCTSEVTNNVYSVLARYKWYREKLVLEHDNCNDGDKNNVLGGRFNSYLNYGIVKGEQWLCQRGQDKMEGYENGGDHFVKLCPIWQLLLYYRELMGGSSKDWYGDVAEIVRTTNENGWKHGQLQLNFMKNTCDILQQDLTDFFIKAGMLKPINKIMDDYGWSAGDENFRLTITQQDCDNLVSYASKYPKPATPVLYYLSANSEKAYKDRLAVEGEYNKGVTKAGETVTVAHAVWKNVTVFETYENDKLIKVAMVGTNSPDQSTTLVRYPAGSTRIEAVQWDGKRILVYGKR